MISKLTKSDKAFIGSTINISNGGTLTVVAPVMRGDNNSRKYYVCTCSVCSLDESLWPYGSIAAPKYNLTHGNVPCGCATNPKWSEGQWHIKVSRLAISLGYEFNGWCGDYKGEGTYLDLYNPETNNHWCTSPIHSFIRGATDPSLNKSLSQRLPDAEFIAKFRESGKYPEGSTFTRDNTIKDNYNCHTHWNYTCPVCSEDMYSKGGFSSTFSVSNATLRNGSIPCRCYTGHIYSEGERVFLLNKICCDEGLVFTGLSEPFKGSMTKFDWVCQEGHKNNCTIDSFIGESSSRCRECFNLIPKVRNGYYPTRLDEDDTLYVMKVTGNNECFIKVGRSFKCCGGNRNKELGYSSSGVYTFETLFKMQGNHEDVWNLEQQTLKHFKDNRYTPDIKFGGSTECLVNTVTDEVVDYVKLSNFDIILDFK